MIGGKKFKTLRDAKQYLKDRKESRYSSENIYKINGRTFKYFVGTHIEWLNF